jgi:replicative superfamily II helicase
MDTMEVEQLSDFIQDESLRHTIQYGVGMHHTGLVEEDRKIVEDLYRKGKI